MAYDVPSNRRRNRLAACLLSYGARIQESVFEVEIDPGGMEGCTRRLQKLLDPKEDSLVVYRLCRACERKRRYYGVAADPIDDEHVFVV